MATPFQATLVNSNVTPPVIDIQAAVDCSSITINDDSNYGTNTDPGHAAANFSNYRIITITHYLGTVYTMTSLPATPSETVTLISPASSLVNSFTQNLITGDGWYNILIQTVPTWNSGIAGTYTNNVTQVYNPTDGKLYQCIANNGAGRPDLTPSNWSVITQAGISIKYSDNWNIALDCNMNACLMNLIEKALCTNQDLACSNLCNNQVFQNALKLILIQFYIQNRVLRNQAQLTTLAFDVANKICNCNATNNQNTQV